MPTFETAEYEPSPWDPINEEVERYEQSGGAESSQLVGEQWIILWTLGARSGNVRKTPLVRVNDGERYAVIGSMGGAPTHPSWVHNFDPGKIPPRLLTGERLAIRVICVIRCSGPLSYGRISVGVDLLRSQLGRLSDWPPPGLPAVCHPER